jgi:hypothetical protein
MTDAGVLAAEDAFFAALLAADRPALDRLLAQDFLLIDVLAGQAVARAALLDLVGSGGLVFAQIERVPAQVSVRHRTGLSVVVGHTRMTMRVPGAELTTDSRYTHVYVLDGGRWRLLAAQGTKQAEPVEPVQP